MQFTGRDTPSLVISFAQKTLKDGQIISKLHVIELGGAAGGYRARAFGHLRPCCDVAPCLGSPGPLWLHMDCTVRQIRTFDQPASDQGILVPNGQPRCTALSFPDPGTHSTPRPDSLSQPAVPLSGTRSCSSRRTSRTTSRCRCRCGVLGAGRTSSCGRPGVPDGSAAHNALSPLELCGAAVSSVRQSFVGHWGPQSEHRRWGCRASVVWMKGGTDASTVFC